jgi:hypothetical protein
MSKYMHVNITGPNYCIILITIPAVLLGLLLLTLSHPLHTFTSFFVNLAGMTVIHLLTVYANDSSKVTFLRYDYPNFKMVLNMPTCVRPTCHKQFNTEKGLKIHQAKMHGNRSSRKSEMAIADRPAMQSTAQKTKLTCQWKVSILLIQNTMQVLRKKMMLSATCVNTSLKTNVA